MPIRRLSSLLLYLFPRTFLGMSILQINEPPSETKELVLFLTVLCSRECLLFMRIFKRRICFFGIFYWVFNALYYISDAKSVSIPLRRQFRYVHFVLRKDILTIVNLMFCLTIWCSVQFLRHQFEYNDGKHRHTYTRALYFVEFQS